MISKDQSQHDQSLPKYNSPFGTGKEYWIARSCRELVGVIITHENSTGDRLEHRLFKMSQNGIATLLKAEKEAHEIVAKARQHRQELLKQAKTDAAAEIAQYKAKKEQELKQIEASNEGGVEGLEKEAEQSVQQELKEIKEVASKKEDDVVKLLIKAVTAPAAEMHINAS